MCTSGVDYAFMSILRKRQTLPIQSNQIFGVQHQFTARLYRQQESDRVRGLGHVVHGNTQNQKMKEFSPTASKSFYCPEVYN